VQRATGSDFASPASRLSFAGTDDERQKRRGSRVPDPDALDLQQVELNRRGFVYPRDRSDMLGARLRHDPHGGTGVRERRVRDELAEVIVV
jgi:hypothetical protein